MTEQSHAIDDAILKALSLVREAEKARGSDESSFKLLLWKAAAEAEYSAFQIALTNHLADYEPPGEKDDETADPSDPLGAARSLLEKAQSSIQSNTKDAYRSARKAVSVLRSAYVELDRPVKKRVVSSPRNE